MWLIEKGNQSVLPSTWWEVVASQGVDAAVSASTFFGLKMELLILLPMLHTSLPTPATWKIRLAMADHMPHFKNKLSTFSRRWPSKSPVFFLFFGLPINSVSLMAWSSSSSSSFWCFSEGTDLSLLTLLVLMVLAAEDDKRDGVGVDEGVGETLHLKRSLVRYNFLASKAGA